MSAMNRRMLRTGVTPIPAVRNVIRGNSGRSTNLPNGASISTSVPTSREAKAFLNSEPVSLVVNSRNDSLGELEYVKCFDKGPSGDGIVRTNHWPAW